MSDEHDEHDEHDAHQNRAGKGYNTLAKITLGGAIVGGAVFAMTKFVSVWKNGEAKKRKFTDWFPNAIDDSAQSFKQHRKGILTSCLHQPHNHVCKHSKISLKASSGFWERQQVFQAGQRRLITLLRQLRVWSRLISETVFTPFTSVDFPFGFFLHFSGYEFCLSNGRRR